MLFCGDKYDERKYLDVIKIMMKFPCFHLNIFRPSLKKCLSAVMRLTLMKFGPTQFY